MAEEIVHVAGAETGVVRTHWFVATMSGTVADEQDVDRVRGRREREERKRRGDDGRAVSHWTVSQTGDQNPGTPRDRCKIAAKIFRLRASSLRLSH